MASWAPPCPLLSRLDAPASLRDCDDDCGRIVPPVEQIAAAGDLAIREKSRDRRPAEYRPHRFYLFVELVLADHPAAHAVEEQHPGDLAMPELTVRLLCGRLGRGHHRAYLSVEDADHRAARDVARARVRADCAHRERSAGPADLVEEAHAELVRDEVLAGVLARELRSALGGVLLVDGECRQSVDLLHHVALG